ncbi:MAG: hypothetical protein WC470_03365 [Candidatus Paceibacterota bacterium]
MINKNLFISILITAGLVVATGIFAAETQTQTPAQKAAAAQAALMVKQKEKAGQEIDRRITFLNNAIEKINAAKKITTEQKTALVSQVQAEIAALQQLKVKINADTDKATLLADRKAIVQQYRIFAVFEPRIAIISYADKILNIADLMDTQTTNADIKAKIADAKTKAQKAITDVLALTPEGYPGNKTILQASKALLTEARKELIDARLLMKQAVTPPSTPATNP